MFALLALLPITPTLPPGPLETPVPLLLLLILLLLLTFPIRYPLVTVLFEFVVWGVTFFDSASSSSCADPRIRNRALAYSSLRWSSDLICVLGLFSSVLFPSVPPLDCGRFRICIGRCGIFGRSSSSSICGSMSCWRAAPVEDLLFTFVLVPEVLLAVFFSIDMVPDNRSSSISSQLSATSSFLVDMVSKSSVYSHRSVAVAPYYR